MRFDKFAVTLAFFLAFSPPCLAQSYYARTDVTPQAYPSPLPCPYSGTGCSAGSGSLTGANYTFTPADFNLPITRITDALSLSGGNHAGYWLDCGGSAEVNFMNTMDTLFFVCDVGSSIHVMSWNAATLTATQVFESGTWGYPFWSYNLANIAYTTYACSSPTTDACLYKLDFTTPSSPVATELQDITSCSGISGARYVGDFSNANDDATFEFTLSTTSGQGSVGAHYLVVYNIANGCRVFDTQALTMSGAWGTNGSASNPQAMLLHNSRISKGGAWVKFAPQLCITQGTVSVTNGSPTVAWASGGTFETSGWGGATININGTDYTISSAGSSTSLTLTTNFSGATGTYTETIYAATSGSGATGCDSNTDIYTWQISGTSDYPLLSATVGDSCGHQAIGFNSVVNQCAYLSKNNFFIRANNVNNGAGTALASNWPAYTSGEVFDQHMSWPNDNSGDTAPFCTSAYGWLTTPVFAPVEAREDEILCVATSGGGERGLHHRNQLPRRRDDDATAARRRRGARQARRHRRPLSPAVC